MRSISRLLIAVLLISLTVLLGVASVQAQPPPVCNFYGSLQVNGVDAPVGTVVSAWMDDAMVASATTTSVGLYVIKVVQPVGETYAARTVAFRINNRATGIASTWEAGTAKNVPLSVGGAPTPSPAAFAVTSLNIDPTQVEPGQIVVITVRVTNTGGAAGSYTVRLKIDGTEEDTQAVADLDPGDDQLVSFTVTRDVPGSYTVAVDGLSGSFTVEAPLPAGFEINVSASPAEVSSGEEVTISVEVTNTGEMEGTYQVILKINGEEEDTQAVTVAGGETETVTFSVSREEAGTYTVEVGGESDSFTVVEEVPSTPTPTPSPSPTPSPTPEPDNGQAFPLYLVGTALGGLAIITASSGYLLRRRRRVLVMNRYKEKLDQWEKDGYDVSEFKKRWFG